MAWLIRLFKFALVFATLGWGFFTLAARADNPDQWYLAFGAYVFISTVMGLFYICFGGRRRQ